MGLYFGGRGNRLGYCYSKARRGRRASRHEEKENIALAHDGAKGLRAKNGGRLARRRVVTLGVIKRLMGKKKVAKYENLMLLDIVSIGLLNIRLPQVLDLTPCPYPQQHVATNGNGNNHIS
jgi:hypothetical protein